MNYAPLKLPEIFEGTEQLIPPDWVAFLYADDEEHSPQTHPSSLPEVGQIVSLLIDRRIVPGDALLLKMFNGMEGHKKRKLRYTMLGRYEGLDSWGYPNFTNVGSGTDDPSDYYRMIKLNDYASCVAWKPVTIPSIDDIEI